MNYQQRDVVFVKELLPSGEEAKHPFLIISCRAANSKENYFTGVMMTASVYVDQFSFRLEDNMFESPLKKQKCQLRLYIIVSFPENKIEKLLTRMNKIHFRVVMEQIKNFVLSID